jgi:hypothetical protein
VTPDHLVGGTMVTRRTKRGFPIGYAQTEIETIDRRSWHLDRTMDHGPIARFPAWLHPLRAFPRSPGDSVARGGRPGRGRGMRSSIRGPLVLATGPPGRVHERAGGSRARPGAVWWAEFAVIEEGRAG